MKNTKEKSNYANLGKTGPRYNILNNPKIKRAKGGKMKRTKANHRHLLINLIKRC